MKSFADWTQELAESVGPVEHHWETRKEAELKGVDLSISDWGMGGDTQPDAPQPNWPVPPLPIPPPLPGPPPAPESVCQCDGGCSSMPKFCKLYTPWDGSNSRHWLCDSCHSSLYSSFIRV